MHQMDFQKIKSKLESFCAYQERSLYEVEKKLNTLTSISEDKKRIISHLYQNNFLNQGRFIEAYVSGKINQKRWGKEKIRVGLIQHKIPKTDVDQAMNNIPKKTYQNNLLILAQRKALSIKKEEDLYLKKAKLMRFLYSKGYTSSDWEEIDFNRLFSR